MEFVVLKSDVKQSLFCLLYLTSIESTHRHKKREINILTRSVHRRPLVCILYANPIHPRSPTLRRSIREHSHSTQPAAKQPTNQGRERKRKRNGKEKREKRANKETKTSFKSGTCHNHSQFAPCRSFQYAYSQPTLSQHTEYSHTTHTLITHTPC